MWFVLSGLLSGSWRFYAVKVLLVESPVIVNAMLPIVFLEGQVVAKNVFSIYHFSLFPLCLIVASLDYAENTLG